MRVQTYLDFVGRASTQRDRHSLSFFLIFESICMYADGTPMSGSIPSMSNKSKKTSHFGFGRLLTLIGMILKTIVAFFVKVLTLATTKFDDEFLFQAGIGKNMMR